MAASGESKAAFTLHRYYLTASTMRSTFMRWMAEHPEGPFADNAKLFPEYLAHMSLWYSTLFVAWDGWTQLATQYGYSSAELDSRWDNPLRVMLQDYRNATMHFSREYVDKRLTAFVADPGSVEFAHTVHNQLGQAILAQMDRLRAQP